MMAPLVVDLPSQGGLANAHFIPVLSGFQLGHWFYNLAGVTYFGFGHTANKPDSSAPGNPRNEEYEIEGKKGMPQATCATIREDMQGC